MYVAVQSGTVGPCRKSGRQVFSLRGSFYLTLNRTGRSPILDHDSHCLNLVFSQTSNGRQSSVHLVRGVFSQSINTEDVMAVLSSSILTYPPFKNLRWSYLIVMRQSICLLINPITVNYCCFNCTPVDHASDYLIDPT